MRILVCGGRDYQDRSAVWRWLDSNTPRTEPDEHGNDMPANVTIIHGACPTGADRWADEWAVCNWTGLAEFPADWKKYGRSAGPRRNQQMLDEGKPDVVAAFPGGAGTASMKSLARRAGIKVVEVP